MQSGIPYRALRVLALAATLLTLVAAPARADERIPQSLLLEFLVDNSRFTLVDARTATEYAESHLIGAINVPHDALLENQAALPADRDTLIVVYCKTGKRAGQLKNSLEMLGYTIVRVLMPNRIHWFDDMAVFKCNEPPSESPASDLPSLAMDLEEETK